MTYDYLIVGAGIFGSVLAERIACELQATVLVIDRRNHIGGNCYSEEDPETGIEVHRYGTHIFHTSSRPVYNYISRFAELNGYHHQVLTVHGEKVFQMPINLETINSFYGLNLRPDEAKRFIAEEAAKSGINNPDNFEEKAVSMIGWPLYDAFIRGYTTKHWGRDPRMLPAEIITRLPMRFNYREDYFMDCQWQGIPIEGYTKIFEQLLSSPRIDTALQRDFFSVRREFKPRKKTVFTGPIDQYFDYCLGKLEWRSVRLDRRVVPTGDFQGTAVMNYADQSVPYTRIHEYRHLHPERSYRHDASVIYYETPEDNSTEPFYPVNTHKNTKLLAQYKNLAQKEKNVVIGGRLGSYCYYDMDKAILAAMECFEEVIRPGH